MHRYCPLEQMLLLDFGYHPRMPINVNAVTLLPAAKSFVGKVKELVRVQSEFCVWTVTKTCWSMILPVDAIQL